MARFVHRHEKPRQNDREKPWGDVGSGAVGLAQSSDLEDVRGLVRDPGSTGVKGPVAFHGGPGVGAAATAAKGVVRLSLFFLNTV